MSDDKDAEEPETTGSENKDPRMKGFLPAANVAKDDWVVVKFGENKLYIGQIEEFDVDESVTVFLRHKRSESSCGLFVRPSFDYRSAFASHDIVAKLKPPVPTRRCELVFDVNADLW